MRRFSYRSDDTVSMSMEDGVGDSTRRSLGSGLQSASDPVVPIAVGLEVGHVDGRGRKPACPPAP